MNSAQGKYGQTMKLIPNCLVEYCIQVGCSGCLQYGITGGSLMMVWVGRMLKWDGVLTGIYIASIALRLVINE